VKARKVKRRGRRPARRPTLPDICREIGQEFFTAAASLEMTGDKIRRAFAEEKSKFLRNVEAMKKN